MADNQINLPKCSQCDVTLLFVDTETIQWKNKKISCRPCEVTFKISANAIVPPIDLIELLKSAIPGYDATKVMILMSVAGSIAWIEQ